MSILQATRSLKPTFGETLARIVQLAVAGLRERLAARDDAAADLLARADCYALSQPGFAADLRAAAVSVAADNRRR